MRVGATALNDSAEVVGVSYSYSTGSHPFIYKNGSMMDLGVGYLEPAAINKGGDIVG
jgi:probable HAF family extracellular repeat protein